MPFQNGNNNNALSVQGGFCHFDRNNNALKRNAFNDNDIKIHILVVAQKLCHFVVTCEFQMKFNVCALLISSLYVPRSLSPPPFTLDTETCLCFGFVFSYARGEHIERTIHEP